MKTKPSRAKSKSTTLPKTILLVDDEPAWLNAMSEALEEQHYKVISADGGEEALKKLKKPYPDLILSDLRMPTMSGFDLFEQVRANPKLKSIPYVFMSSIDDYDAKRVAKELGADDFVTKPFDSEDVKKVMSDLMRRFKI
jgi:CheY-like chemotaxis protein